MATGSSLHIGLNRVDPAHYQGWSGDLAGCENDARDMEALARAQGFGVAGTLLSEAGTSAAVLGALTQAASRLVSGDILFLSFSGHGSQVPDRNDDEYPDGLDETWVLFDRQLIDDELYAAFGRFAPGVRILVLSDSCHSGTAVRALPAFLRPEVLEARFGATDAPTLEKRVRTMPDRLRGPVYEAHKQLYDGLQTGIPASGAAEVAATVLLMSGCQDSQTSADGDRNGLFTGNLLGVWSEGAYTGPYERFHRDILARMPIDQQPNLYWYGPAAQAFLRQRPFTI